MFGFARNHRSTHKSARRQFLTLVSNRTARSRFFPLRVEALEPRLALAGAALPADMVSWYRAEGDAADFAGSNDGTLLNGATFTAGKVGQAFLFDGDDDQVNIPHNANLNPGSQFTIEAWVNPSDSEHGRPIAQKRSNGNAYTFETTHSPYGPDDGLQFVVWFNHAPTSLQTPAGVLPKDEWHHVAATYNGTLLRIFVDGVQQAETSGSGAIDDSDADVVIGQNVVISDFAWKGAIDELSFYSRALSQAELQTIVAAGSKGKQAAIVVTTAADEDDGSANANLGAGTSLREAIAFANANPGEDVITFNIPGAGVKTINVGSGPGPTTGTPLPDITDPVIIDGYTQPGAAMNTDPTGFNGTLLIELNGASAAPSGLATNGLRITGGGSTVRGLVINRFFNNGIYLRFVGNNRIEGNFLGTDPSGTIARGNEDGVDLEAPNNIVGGTTPEARNVISGNVYGGVDIDSFAGGVGNGNLVQGNLIGTTASGTAPLGNADHGVDIDSGVTLNTIGGTTTAARNVIAFNGVHGVVIRAGTGNAVLGNSIHSNNLLGIDLNNNGVTANDPGDLDTGANNRQNFPVLTSATTTGGATTITGTLNSTASGTFRIEFFANTAADPSGFGEGQTFLGFTTVTDTNGDGNEAFSFSPVSPVPVGQFITATATNTATSDTSEFSGIRAVQAAVCSLVVDTTSDANNTADGVTSLREAINCSNASVGVLDTISFSIPRPSTTDLVSWWRAEENANDSMDGNNGTLQNGATFAAGRYGRAFDLDGVNDYVEAPDAANLDGMAQLTVDAWVKFDALPVGKEQFILSKAQAVGVGSNSYAIWLQGETMRLTAAVETVSGLQTVQSPEIFTDTTGFHHLALTYDGAAVRLFVDGVLKSSGALSGSILNTPYSYFIGRRSGTGVDGNGDAFSGLVDEAGIYDRALSAAEVLALATGPRTISPASALPTITDPVVIDGYTQPGASQNSDPDGFNGTLLIELNGASAGAAVGLDIAAGASTVRGLAINRFSQEAIVLRSGDGNTIAGNLLGTDSTGNAALPNRGGVISYLGSDANTIGGATPADRNVISGNLWNGIELNGVEIAGFDAGSANNVVQGNFLGTNAAGEALGNGIHGVYVVFGSQGNTIGGTSEDTGNRIAFNAGAGVKVEVAGSTSSVLGNSIFANGGLGIDLDNNGITPNDPGDEDSGPNQLQNFPVILTTSFPGELKITGSLDAEQSSLYRIEFFASYAADPSGAGEGQRLLGVRGVTTDASGHAAFIHELPPVADGQWITATATRLDSDGETLLETSEFSAAVQALADAGASADLEVTISDSPDPVLVGDSVTYTITATNHGPATATGVVVVSHGPAGQPFNSLSIPVGGLASGAASSFQLVFTPAEVGTFSVAASVLANEDDPDLTNNSFTATTIVEPRSTFELEQARYEVREGEAFAVLTVRRTGGLSSSASVEFDTVNGTAGQRSIGTGFSRIVDFTTTSGELFFRGRQNVATIRVPIGDDGGLEPDESFRVVLSNPSAGTRLGAISSAEVIIHDNDPTISFIAGSSERNEGVTGRAAIEVQLTPASNQFVTVAYAPDGGSATAGADYSLVGSSLTFRPGETRKFINFSNVNDTLFEGNETAFIELSSPTNAFLGATARHRVTIVDNDPQPPPVDPGSSPATAVAIDLATLPRQSYRQYIGKGDVDTFKVTLGPLEYLALDVDPSTFVPSIPGVPSSKLTILDGDGVRVLATIGASAEPESGQITANAAHLFQADADGGTYFVQLSTTATGKSYSYSLGFQRIGVSEEVPTPDKLNASGPMYAWFDGDKTVGITGPTGYGFTLEGPWQQTTVFSRRTGLTSQTLTLLRDSHFALKSPQGVELPLLANRPINIRTTANRFGNVVGVVDGDSIELAAAIDIVPLNNALADVFGSGFHTVGLLSGEWRISLGGAAFNILGTAFDATEKIDQLLPGVPYLRKFGGSTVDARLGGLSMSFAQFPMTWIFDPADPMLFVRLEPLPSPIKGLGVSKHGLFKFKPQDAPDPAIDAGVTEFAGHLYASGAVPFQVGPFNFEVEGEMVLNVDADRDGRPLGDLRDVADIFQHGGFSEAREVLRDIQLGSNGVLTVGLVPTTVSETLSFPLNKLGDLLKAELGRTSVVLNGLTETVWVRGQQAGVAFPDTPLEISGGQSILVEGLIDFDGDSFFFAVTGGYKPFPGVELAAKFIISNEGITASLTGSIGWSADIDYGGGKVGGKAKATITANIAIEIDDDGDVHLSGSISARGRLTAKIGNRNKELFDDSIEAHVRSKGFRFKFPLGVGNLDLDLFH
jgi:CSLREA domain-containing protein/uncharacterized repeat protein (TIGR01451 family)